MSKVHSAQPVSHGAALKLLFTCSSAMTAEAVTYPIDMVKTRLQLQGELGSSGAVAAGIATTSSTQASTAASRQVGAVRMAVELVRREGLRGLYAGLSPALVRHIFYTGTRISAYERLRSTVARWETALSSKPSSSSSSSAASTSLPTLSKGAIGTGGGSSSSSGSGGGSSGGSSGGSIGGGLASKLLMGLTAGAVGQAVAVPADLVKVRLQAEGRLVASGKLAAPRYKGMADCLSQIVSKEGVLGLWRGGGPAIQRAALVNLGELATYDQAKQAIMATGFTGGDNLATHTAASVCSGFFASVVSVPADVVKTRMMSQDAATPLYRSSLDCLVKSVRAEGLMALYKGFFPTWGRLGPWQLVFWTTYEHTRKAFDLGGF